jgi:hypothetical protein
MKTATLFSKTHRFQAFIASSLLAFTACGPNAGDFSILPASQSTFQGSVANNKVDILWVVDNSGSMLTKQQNLSAGFSSFANVFQSKNFDFRMAVVTSDIRGAPTGQEGVFQARAFGGTTYTIVTNSTPNMADHFKANVEVGDTGNANATILDAINLSLSPSLLAGANTGFLRSDAHLAVIVLSDADDNDSAASVSATTTFLNNLKPDRFDVITRTYKKNFTVSAVVVDTSNASNAACPMPFEDGIKFKQIVSATNGSLASICEADFSAGLNQISQRIAEAITEIPLGRVPNVATIRITFNGTVVPKDPVNGWSYSATGNKVIFHGNSIPTDNTSISIDYTPNDIIR